MRCPHPALVALLWAPVGLSACLSAPEPQDLLAVGFRSPEQAFRTFQTALRADLPDLEYRCLSSDFKAREGIHQLGWREFREELFGSRPWLKLAAKAEIRETLPLPDGRRRVVAHLDTLFVDETFAVDFRREDYHETFDAEGLLEDDTRPWNKTATEREGRLVLTVPMPQGVAVHEIVEFRAGREWKIDGFELLPAP